MTDTKHNAHIGGSFDDFLADEGLLEDSTALAVKRVLAWQITEAMKAQKVTKTVMASRMHTTRATLDRLLDTEETSLTLSTLASAANALGKDVQIQLVDRAATI